MDNHYSAPELFVILKAKYKILACGTIKTHRKGCDKNVMNLSKSASRIKLKVFYNPINVLLYR